MKKIQDNIIHRKMINDNKFLVLNIRIKNFGIKNIKEIIAQKLNKKKYNFNAKKI